jgi:hypothetical protein
LKVEAMEKRKTSNRYSAELRPRAVRIELEPAVSVFGNRAADKMLTAALSSLTMFDTETSLVVEDGNHVGCAG